MTCKYLSKRKRIERTIETIKTLYLFYATYKDKRSWELQVCLSCMKKCLPEKAQHLENKKLYKCPACGIQISYEKAESMKYCDNCGQRIIFDEGTIS